MKTPPGFQVQFVAAEPLVRQPVAIDFDDRGRLWVMQYLQYPNPAGLKRVAWDRFSRTKYDRVPEPPPHGPRGADRLTILEDTDGDGRADRARDFLDGLNLATGFAFGHGGVFVLQVPYLLFYADADRNDVPDADPEVLLVGFGMEDAHSVANSLVFGPDGWLYGAQGSTVTANIRGIEFQQGVWRYHPPSKRFELFYEGGGNTWGVDFDAQGQLLASTNLGPNLMLHGVQGGYYWKSFGKHGALHNPYAYGYFDHVPYRGFQGGHVTDGGIVYSGATFPAEFRGQYIAGNLLSHNVYWHTLVPQGSSFRAEFGGALLESNDTWFAPSDVTQGPDGAVYVADWHDQRTAHPDPDADWDRRNGRIYRIQAQGAQPSGVPNAAECDGEALVALVGHENGWLSRRARNELARRRDPHAAAQLRKLLLNSTGTPSEATSEQRRRRLEQLWAHYVSAGLDDALALVLLEDDDPAVRRWTVRLIGDDERASREVAAALDHRAEVEPDATVRSQLACTARRLPAAQAMPILNATMLRSVDGDDPFIPLLIWWAIERHAVQSIDEIARRFNTPAAWNVPLKRDVILERLARRWAAEGTPATLSHAQRLLAAAPDDAAARRLAAAIDLGLAERSATVANEPAPAELTNAVQQRWQAQQNDETWLRLAARLNITGALQHAVQLAQSADADVALRTDALAVVRDTGSAADARQVAALVGRDQPEAVQIAALAALARWDDPAVGEALLAAYPSLSATVQSTVRDVLLSRPASAQKLLAAVSAGAIDRQSVPVEQARQAMAHDDPAVQELVRKLWGNLAPATSEEKLAEVRRLNNDVRAGTGDRTVGAALFKKHCAVCHELFGEGGKVGPELTTANRHDRAFLLTSLVDPSSVIRREYVSHAVHTRDGRVLTGLIVEQTAAAVTLRDAKAQDTLVARGDIEAIEESPVSLMPEGLYRELKPQDLRDLFSYLEGSGRISP